MIFILLSLTCIYVSVKVFSLYVWKNHQNILIRSDQTKNVSIIIVARNEEERIMECLRSIVDNQYPIDQYEIILVDDHSTDRTIDQARSLGLSNLCVVELSDHLSGASSAHKKAGIKLGIENVQNEIILQTDADCVVHQDWIRTMVSYLEEHSLVTGPIKVEGQGFLSYWQLYDGLLTIIGTFTGIQKKLWFSGNAGNMAFHKSDFQRFSVDGHSPGASGDDIFFINYLASQNLKIAFANAKSALVRTKAEPSLSTLFQQRLRWATKTKAYRPSGIQFLMVSIFLFYCTLILLALSLPFLSSSLLYFLLGGLLIKWITDLILLLNSADFFDEKYKILLSPFFSAAHLVYVVVIGWMGLLKKNYLWKGRLAR